MSGISLDLFSVFLSTGIYKIQIKNIFTLVLCEFYALDEQLAGEL